MATMYNKEYASLGTRGVFNKTLRHLVSVTSIVESVDKGRNLADTLNGQLAEGTLNRDQVGPIIALALAGKFNYSYKSLNVDVPVSDFQKIVETFQRWDAVDVVVAYHHSNLGIIPINPSNADHWMEAQDLKRDELIVIYAKSRFGKKSAEEAAIAGFVELLHGRSPVESGDLIDEAKKKREEAARARAAEVAAQQPVAQPVVAVAQPAKPAAPVAGRNLTPKYGVQVTNELFHNGNVEAWKNIIESYEKAHSGSKVIVYHEGELIQDLNSLFKWGKVKHGGVIFIQIAGANIKNVSRLQKYLFEGASNRFETFLKHDVNKTLALF